jgi:hypothetical protein
MRNAMTFNQSEHTIGEIHRWYISQINSAASKAGGVSRLSVILGYEEKTLFKILKRSSFSALRRVVKQLNEMDLI